MQALGNQQRTVRLVPLRQKMQGAALDRFA